MIMKRVIVGRKPKFFGAGEEAGICFLTFLSKNFSHGFSNFQKFCYNGHRYLEEREINCRVSRGASIICRVSRREGYKPSCISKRVI